MSKELGKAITIGVIRLGLFGWVASGFFVWAGYQFQEYQMEEKIREMVRTEALR